MSCLTVFAMLLTVQIIAGTLITIGILGLVGFTLRRRASSTAAAAEYLKKVVHEVICAFHEGAGINDGKPHPMTYDLAVQYIWREIDRVLYERSPAAEQRVTLRVVTERPLPEAVAVLERLGRWVFRSTPVPGQPTTVIYAAGTSPIVTATLLGALSDEQITVTNISSGLLF